MGCDVVGAGELRIALAAGMDPASIVMHGNAKTDADIQAALDARIGYIAVWVCASIPGLTRSSTGVGRRASFSMRSMSSKPSTAI